MKKILFKILDRFFVTKPKEKSYEEKLFERNVHPGEYLKYLLSDLGVSDTGKKIAEDMKIPVWLYYNIKNEKADLTTDTALSFDIYFGKPSGTFYKFQQNHTWNKYYGNKTGF